MPGINQDEFIQSLEGELTTDQVAQLMGLGEGDTDTSSDEGGEPGASDKTVQPGDKGEASKKEGEDAGKVAEDGQTGTDIDPAGLNASNAVIQAKDGKHTIGYEKLVEAREAEKHWRAQAEASQRQLAELQAQAKEREQAGEAPTKTDNQAAAATAAIANGVDPGLFGDFSEEALASGIAKLVEQQVSARVAAVEQKLEPIRQKQASDAATSHYDTIYEKHPDADSIVESKELESFINSQPSFVRDGYVNVLKNGTTAQVIELFDNFKHATGATQAATNSGDVKAAAKAVVANAKAQVPASLTDFPGGRAGATSREDAMADMDGTQLYAAMEDMTPEQIEQFLNRL